MAEFPALPLWTDAYLADTLHLSDAEHGRYLLLLFAMWRAPMCRLPNNDGWLARKFGRSEERVVAELRPLLREFFKCSGNWITQKRLTREREFVGSQREKQAGRAGKRWGAPPDAPITRAARMAEARRKGTHTPGEWALLKQIFSCCVHCGTTEYPLERDHIKPVYQGGSDAIENLQPSCARCNASKGPDDTDKRTMRRPGWRDEFESVGRKLLLPLNSDACENACHSGTAPTPTPTPTPLTPFGGRAAARSTRWAADRKVLLPWLHDADEARRSHGLPEIDLGLEAEKFANFWAAKSGAQATKLDWRRTWINWALKAERARNGGKGPTAHDKFLNAAASLIREQFADGAASESDGNDPAGPSGRPLLPP